MEEICRACLDKNKNMLPIFKSKTKPLQISEMISSICSINVSIHKNINLASNNLLIFRFIILVVSK